MGTTREQVQALLGILPDFRNNGQTTSSSPKTTSLDDEEEPSSMYKPSGMTASTEVAKCAAALEEAKSIKRDLCLEGAQSLLDILASNNPTRVFAELSTVQIDHPDRVDPRWIMYIMEHLASAKRGPLASTVTRTRKLPPNPKRWIPGGAGFASKTVDVFRVSWLYLKFALSSDSGLKKEYLLEMMKIAVYGKSLTAYRTAVRLGYASISPAEEITGDYANAVIAFVNEKGVENLEPLPPNMQRILETSVIHERREHISDRLVDTVEHEGYGNYTPDRNADAESGTDPANAAADAVRQPPDPEGLRVLTETLVKKGVAETASPFSGDGFTVPHEFNEDNKQFAAEFVIILEFGPFVYARKTTNADDAGQWMLMKSYPTQGSSDDSKFLMWTEHDDEDAQPIIVSGVFRVSEADGAKRLTHSPRYVCSFVSCGGYGKVFRIQTSAENDREKKTFAVKFFDGRMDWRDEMRSVEEIARILETKENEIKTFFGDGFENAFCALHQSSEDATEVEIWLKSIGNRALCIVLKTLAYDEATFRKRVSDDKMHEYVKTLIKCCSYFFRYHPRTIYKDWKPNNMIWNDKEIMLVDLALHGFHSRDYMPNKSMELYLDNLKAKSETVGKLYIQGYEAIQYGPEMRREVQPYLIPAQSVMILHQACTVLTTKNNTVVFDPTGDLLRRLKDWVLQSLLIDPDTKMPLGSERVSELLLEIVRESQSSTIGMDTERAASVGGSLATSDREGRSTFIMSLSGFGVLVLASLLPR